MQTFVKHIATGFFALFAMLACLLPSQAFAAIDAEQDTFAKGLELVAYTPTESDSSTGCMYCDNQEMFWVPGGGYWAILLPQTGEKAIGHFFTADPNAERREISTLKGNGSGMLAADLNNNGRVNIVDAQYAYELAKGLFTYHEEDMALWLAADVNADGFLDASDALAIQLAMHAGLTPSVTYAAMFQSSGGTTPNAAGGYSEVVRYEYAAGTASATVPSAEREGFTFLGWFDEAGNPLGELLPTEDRVPIYHAVWEELILPQLLCIGDSFGDGWTPEGKVTPWCKHVADALNAELINYSVGGMGVVNPIDGRTFNSQLASARSNGLDPDYIFIATGYNDFCATWNQMYNNMSAILNNIANWWPNAQVYVFGLTWGSRWYGAAYETLSDALQQACNEHGVFYQGKAWTWLFDRDDLVASDYIHPNEQGQQVIAQRMLMATNGEDPTIYNSTLIYDYGDYGHITVTRNYLTITVQGWGFTYRVGNCVMNLPPAYKCTYVQGPGGKAWWNHKETIVTMGFDRGIYVKGAPYSTACDWKSGGFLFSSTLIARHPTTTKQHATFVAETWDQPTSRE